MANHIVRNKQASSKSKKDNKNQGKILSQKNSKTPRSKRKNVCFTWIHNRKFQLILGFFLLFFAIFLFLSFCSFFTTHSIDTSTATPNIFETIRSGNTTPDIGNKLGIIGLYFSFLFIQFGFGIASFGFIFLFALWGFYLVFKKAFLPLTKSLVCTIMSVIWTSLVLGAIFGKDNKTDWLGGNIGNTISNFLIERSLGSIGFVLLMIFLAIVILVIFFGLTFSNPKFMKKNREKSKEKTQENEDKKTENKEIKEDIKEVPENSDPFKGPLRIGHSYPEEPMKFEEIFEEKTKETPEENTCDKTKNQITEIDTDTKTFKETDEFTDECIKNSEKTEIYEEVNEIEEFGKNEIKDAESYISSLPPKDPRDELIHYKFPTIDLLKNHTKAVVSPEERELEIQNNKNEIRNILSNFGIEILSISAAEGPTVTMYEIVPAAGVRINKIKNLEEDIALSLSAIGIRIIAPIPGKGTVGIEVPNSVPNIVPIKDTIGSEQYKKAIEKMALPVAIGKTISNEVYVFDLTKMPHVLMAGATGQGKSVGLNTILVSLLYAKHPSELKFVLVDPKKVELTLYSKIERHYLAKISGETDAIITDTKQVVRTLNSLCIEMDNRYELLKSAQCRNISEYNEKFKSRHLNPENGHRFLPYIVLIFDEFADCIMTAGREVESPLARLAQLARAVGIHLIIATQRPSVNIITGVIKANFPARVAFRVSSKVDSRTILDNKGAERLIGKGDMLISSGNEPIRIQCAFVDTPEIEKICDFIGSQHGFTEAYRLPEVPEDTEDNTQASDDGETDSCFADAARIVVQSGHGSTSLLQRKLKLGYNRAGRIMDQLEREGIVGPFEGSKAREVLIKDGIVLEEKLKNMGLL